MESIATSPEDVRKQQLEEGRKQLSLDKSKTRGKRRVDVNQPQPKGKQFGGRKKQSKPRVKELGAHDAMLNKLKGEKVVIHVGPGMASVGILVDFDRYTVILNIEDGGELCIFKHAMHGFEKFDAERHAPPNPVMEEGDQLDTGVDFVPPSVEEIRAMAQADDLDVDLPDDERAA